MRRPHRSTLGNHCDKLTVSLTHFPVWLEPAEESSMRIARPAVRLNRSDGHLVLVPDRLR